MSLPEGAIPTESYWANEPQCQKCFHYLSEHMEETGPCTRTIAYLPDPELEKVSKGSGIDVIHPRIKCDCRKFIPKEKS